ncbi:MAG: hypothetical protein AB1349_13085 [Elusimicrobiota bacterium]
MKKICIVLAVVCFLTGGLLEAELEISGFVDSKLSGQQGEKSSFEMGAFEIDLASKFSDKVSFEGAVVVEGETVGLGQTLVDVNLLKEDYLHLQVGLLDIPFGIDYQVFATPDRKLVSAPLTTELMMDGGWGDIGINLCGSISKFNYNLYGVNGMGEDEGVPVNQLADNNNAKTVGGRIGVLPKEDVEIGFSYTQGPYLDDNTEDILSRAGVDIQASYKIIKLKGEYIAGEEEIPEAQVNKHDGYYVELLGNITDKLYGVARYGSWKPKDGDGQTRLTLTVGYDLLENVSIRTEYQINQEKPEVDNNLFTSQIVISF